jgi:hypothetical protein
MHKGRESGSSGWEDADAVSAYADGDGEGRWDEGGAGGIG